MKYTFLILGLLVGFLILGPILQSVLFTIDTTPPPLKPPRLEYFFLYTKYEVPPANAPNFIRDGHKTYIIHYINHSEMLNHDISAITVYELNSIYVDSTVDIREAIFHELLHIAIHDAPEDTKFEGSMESLICSKCSDHEWIVPTSPELLRILKQNPYLSSWLFFENNNTFICVSGETAGAVEISNSGCQAGYLGTLELDKNNLK